MFLNRCVLTYNLLVKTPPSVDCILLLKVLFKCSVSVLSINTFSRHRGTCAVYFFSCKFNSVVTFCLIGT